MRKTNKFAALLAAVMCVMTPISPMVTYAMPEAVMLKEGSQAFTLKILNEDENVIFEKTTTSPETVEIYNFDGSLAKSTEYDESVSVKLKHADISGHNFIKWAVTENGNTVKVAPEYEKVSFTMKLLDQDELEFYSVTAKDEITLIVTDRAGIVVSKQTFTDEKILKLEAAELDGYTFSEWKVSEEGTTVKVTPVYVEKHAEEITLLIKDPQGEKLVDKTVPNPTILKVLDMDGTIGQTVVITKNSDFTLSPVNESGYTFVEWQIQESGDTITFTPVYEQESFKVIIIDSESKLYEQDFKGTVTINVYNFDGSVGRTADYSESVTTKLAHSDIPGYIFSGWEITEKDNVIDAVPKYTKTDTKVTLTLVDNEKNVIASGDFDGKAKLTVLNTEGGIDTEKEYEESTEVQLSYTLPEGFLFDRWEVTKDTAGITVKPVYKPADTEPFTITIKGENLERQIVAYQPTTIVTFDPEGKELSTVTVDEAQEITLSYTPAEGLILTGWAEKQDGALIGYTALVDLLPNAVRKITIRSEANEVLAEVETDKTVYLTYNYGDSPTTIGWDASYDATDDGIELSDPAPRYGYKFDSWTITKTEDDQSVNIEATVKWVESPYLVNVYEKDGSLAAQADLLPGKKLVVYKNEATPGSEYENESFEEGKERAISVEHKEIPEIKFEGWKIKETETEIDLIPEYSCDEPYLIVIVDALTGESVFTDKYEIPTNVVITDKDGKEIVSERKVDVPHVIYIERSESEYSHALKHEAFVEEMIAYTAENAGKIINVSKTTDDEKNQVTVALEFADAREYTVTYKDQSGETIYTHTDIEPISVTVFNDAGSAVSTTEHSGNSVVEITPEEITGKTFVSWKVEEDGKNITIKPEYEVIKTAPKITSTEATINSSKSVTVYPARAYSIKDQVNYENLEGGRTYTMYTALRKTPTGSNLKDIMASFNADASGKGSITSSIGFYASDYINSLDNMNMYVYEELRDSNGKMLSSGISSIVLNPADVTSPIGAVFSGKTTLTGKTISNDDFTFVLYDESGNQVGRTTNDANGNFKFSPVYYDKEGTYKYSIIEETGSKTGYRYNTGSNSYDVTVKVTRAGWSDLSIVISGLNSDGSGANFFNSYDLVKTSATISAKVAVSEADKSASNPVFTVVLERANSNSSSAQSQTAAANGTVTFSTLVFSQPGTYSYDLYQKPINNNYYKVDTSRHRIVFTVVATNSGSLAYTMTYDGASRKPNEIVLNNSYIGPDKSSSSETTDNKTNGTNGTNKTNGTNNSSTGSKTGTNTSSKTNGTTNSTGKSGTSSSTAAKTYAPNSISFSGTVTLEGKDLEAGDFTFTLKNSSGTVVDSAKNLKDGSFTLSTRDSIKKPGTYKFTIAETKGSKAGYTYSKETYTVTVKATDDDHGSLDLEIQSGLKANGSGADFSNTYKVSSSTVNNTNSGTVKITTTVVDETKTERSHMFNYRIILDDKTINGTFGGAEFEDGEATFNLKHGESMTISGIPENVKFNIYQEGDEFDYSTSVISGSGVIKAGKTIYSYFRNKRVEDPAAAPEATPDTTTDYYVPTEKDNLKYSMPWIIGGGLIAAGGAGYYFYKKRQEEEYDDFDDEDEDLDGEDEEKEEDNEFDPEEEKAEEEKKKKPNDDDVFDDDAE